MTTFDRFRRSSIASDSAIFPVDVLQAIALDLSRFVLRDMIKAHFNDNSCVVTSGLVADIMTALGVKAEVVPCHAICMNPAFSRWSESTGKIIPNSEEEREAVAAAGGLIVIMSGEHRRREEVKTLAGALAHMSRRPEEALDDDDFPGHVVVVLTTAVGQFFVDLSIDQIQKDGRAEKFGMTAEPIVLPLSSEFEREGDAFVVANNGVTVIYERIADQSFRDSPDFTRQKEDDPMFGLMANELRAAMTFFLMTVFRSLQGGGDVRSIPSAVVANVLTTQSRSFGIEGLIMAVEQEGSEEEGSEEEEVEPEGVAC